MFSDWLAVVHIYISAHANAIVTMGVFLVLTVPMTYLFTLLMHFVTQAV